MTASDFLTAAAGPAALGALLVGAGSAPALRLEERALSAGPSSQLSRRDLFSRSSSGSGSGELLMVQVWGDGAPGWVCCVTATVWVVAN